MLMQTWKYDQLCDPFKVEFCCNLLARFITTETWRAHENTVKFPPNETKYGKQKNQALLYTN